MLCKQMSVLSLAKVLQSFGILGTTHPVTQLYTTEAMNPHRHNHEDLKLVP
jgi:hypothetical protein